MQLIAYTRPLSRLEEWLERITSELAAWDAEHPDRPSAPFAVNLIVHKSNDRLEEDLALCVKYRVPVVITSLGAREDVNQAIHSHGGTVLHDVINNRFAKKVIEKGADGLDPDNLPESDPSAMNFGSGGNSEQKAWKDIWGCGQGIGVVKAVVPAADKRLSDAA